MSQTTKNSGCTLSRECVVRFEELSIRHGIGLTALVKGKDSGECISLVARFLSECAVDAASIKAHAFGFANVSEEDFCKWVAELDCGLPSDGEIGTAEEFFNLMHELAKERAARRAEHRRLMQEKNRTVNAPKPMQFDTARDCEFMLEALKEAALAKAAGEVPVGAVMVIDGQIAASAHNRVLRDHDPTAHAEMLVIRKACQAVGNERLVGATLYVTLEPCAMCAAALAHARVARVVWGADDERAGALASAGNVPEAFRMNHRPQITRGVLAAECSAVLSEFFAALRQRTCE